MNFIPYTRQEGNYLLISIPIINKSFVVNYAIINTPIHKTEGISNQVFLEGEDGRRKHFVIFLEYDAVSRSGLVKDLKRIGETNNFHQAFVFRSRPGQNDRWHVIIPEIVTMGEWLETLANAKCDQSYKSMSIKRGYSVLRIGRKKDISLPEYAFTFVNSKKPKIVSRWHSKFLEIHGVCVAGQKKRCGSQVVGYVTGHDV